MSNGKVKATRKAGYFMDFQVSSLGKWRHQTAICPTKRMQSGFQKRLTPKRSGSCWKYG